MLTWHACDQAVSRLARVLTALDRAPPAAKLVPPTLDFLLGMGAVSSNPLHRWLLRRCGQWCALSSSPPRLSPTPCRI